MKAKITAIIREAIRDTGVPVELSIPEEENFGHYSTNVAMRAAKAAGKKPLDLARELAEKIMKAAPDGFFEKVEAVPPGFINVWLSAKTVTDMFTEVAHDEHCPSLLRLRRRSGPAPSACSTSISAAMMIGRKKK